MENLDSLKDYFKEINKIPLLTREEERRLLEESPRNIEKLVNSNLRYVVSVAKKYQGLGLLLPDLVQEGNIGLMDAVEKYDIDRGHRFVLYARHRIKKTILKAIYEKGLVIRIPLETYYDFDRINRSNSPEDLHISENRRKYIESLHTDVGSLDDIVKLDEEGGEISLLETVCGPFNINEIDNQIYREHVNEILKNIFGKINLSNKHIDIIKSRYGIDKNGISYTLKEIGEKYNLTKERIRQIEKKILQKIRRSRETMKLNDYTNYELS